MPQFRHADLLAPTQDTGWFKSSHSASTEACVEVSVSDGHILVRHSKTSGIADVAPPTIAIAERDWASFLDATRRASGWRTAAGMALTVADDGSAILAFPPAGIELAYTATEWAAFAAGAAGGHFDLIDR